MRNVDRRIVIVSAFIFIVVLAWGLMRYLINLKEDPRSRDAVEMKRTVEAVEIKYGTIVSEVKATGRLNSVAKLELIAEASGKIIVGEVPLKKGAIFNQGQTLFTVYPDEAILALKARKSQFLQTLANLLPDISIDFPKYEKTMREFFNSIDLNKELPQFPAIEDEKLKIFLSSRNVWSEYYSILKDEFQLKRHSVKAPFEGTYSEVYLEAGAFVNTGGRVAQAIRTDVLELEVPLERVDALWVKIGDKVKIKPDNRDATYQGEVIRKSQFVDPNTQSQSIFIQVKNHQKLPLLAGEYLTAVFPGHPIEGVMEIPRNSVFNFNEVFVVIDGRLYKRNINVVKMNEKTLLFNGPEEGTTVVTQPLINVMEGILVDLKGKHAKGKNYQKSKDEKANDMQ